MSELGGLGGARHRSAPPVRIRQTIADTETGAPPTLLLTIVDAPHHAAEVRTRTPARFVFAWQDPAADVAGIDATHTARCIAAHSQMRTINGLPSRLGYADAAA